MPYLCEYVMTQIICQKRQKKGWAINKVISIRYDVILVSDVWLLCYEMSIFTLFLTKRVKNIYNMRPEFLFASGQIMFKTIIKGDILNK
jgi:hypothetical protein